MISPPVMAAAFFATGFFCLGFGAMVSAVNHVNPFVAVASITAAGAAVPLGGWVAFKLLGAP